jgi:hypothetical protein
MFSRIRRMQYRDTWAVANAGHCEGKLSVMRKAMWIIALVFVAVAIPTVLRASDITYTVISPLIEIGSISGTITTDGNLGNITFADIVQWDLDITGTVVGGPNPSEILQNSNSNVSGSGMNLSATTTSLYFNYSVGDNGFLKFLDPTTDNFYQMVTGAPVVGPTGFDELRVAPGASQFDVKLTGNQVVASAAVTPEPGTGILLQFAIGLALVIRKQIARGH